MADKLEIKEGRYDGGGKREYHLYVNGVKTSLIYYNMTGYNVEHDIPVPYEGRPDGIGLYLPECSIERIRREVRKANKEWAKVKAL